MSKSPEFHFEASAYLQTLMGRELIRSEELALIELVKNSYDSGAKSVLITIRSPSIKEPGEISLLDDGAGMDIDQFKQSYMFAGFSHKGGIQPSIGRVQTGEKGIGRFAADRLGPRLTIVTKSASEPLALTVEIDWTKFSDRKKKFNDVSVPYRQEKPPAALATNGTLLTISPLREQWGRASIEGLRRALSQLLDPYAGPSDFKVDVQVPNSPALSGEILSRKIDKADIEITFRVNDQGQVIQVRKGSQYEGTPQKSIYKPLDYDAAKLVGLRGRFFYFINRPKKEETNGVLPGVRLYRDGFRVEPMGSGKADWLGIEAKRAKRAGHAHIVPTRLFGFVSVSRVKNPELKDTTSREALIDSPEVQALFDALTDQVKFLEGSIQTDVAEPRWKENRTRQAVALGQARLQSLSILSSGLGHELRQPLQAIRMDADNIKRRLSQLGIVDSDINAAQQSIDNAIERIDRNINMIASIATGNVDQSEALDASEVIRNQAAFLKTRAAAQGVTLSLKIPAKLMVMSNETLIGMVLINLIQNAVDAFQNVVDDRAKQIEVSASSGRSGMASISVTDNADGIPASIKSKIFKRFTTQKTGGWGVGLYNCRLFLESHGGSITFDSNEGLGTTFIFTLPKVVS